MKKWLLSLVVLTLVVGGTTAGVVFAVTGNGSDSPVQESVGQTEPDSRGDRSTIGPLPLPGDADLDPNTGVAIVRDDGTGNPRVVILPVDDTATCDEEPCQTDAQPPITSIDDLDPNECSFVHNINACFTDGQPPAGIALGEYTQLFFLAREDLGQRLALDINAIKLAELAKVEWSDTSLGNPQPDTLYAQVIVPGFKMVLEADGQTYEYHTDAVDRVEFVG